MNTTIISSERRFCPVVEAVTETSFRITESGGRGVVIVATVGIWRRSNARSARMADFLYSPLCCSSLATSAVQPV